MSNYYLKPDNVLQRITQRCGTPICAKCLRPVERITLDVEAACNWKVTVTCHGAVESFVQYASMGRDPDINRYVFRDHVPPTQVKKQVTQGGRNVGKTHAMNTMLKAFPEDVRIIRNKKR